MPGLVGVAVNVTLVPEQIAPAGLAAIDTLTGFGGTHGVPAILAHHVPQRSDPPEGSAAYS